MNYKKLGEEALREASSIADLKSIENLISLGVDVNSRNAVNGWTALHWAAYRGHLKAVTLLLENGADKTMQTYQNETAECLAEDKHVQLILGGSGTKERKNKLPIIPNYLRNPPMTCPRLISNGTKSTNQSGIDSEQSKNILVNKPEKTLTLRLVSNEGIDVEEVIEIEIPASNLTYYKLLKECAKELKCKKENILKILKICTPQPNVIIRNDRDVQKLTELQVIKVVKENGLLYMMDYGMD